MCRADGTQDGPGRESAAGHCWRLLGVPGRSRGSGSVRCLVVGPYGAVNRAAVTGCGAVVLLGIVPPRHGRCAWDPPRGAGTVRGRSRAAGTAPRPVVSGGTRLLRESSPQRRPQPVHGHDTASGMAPAVGPHRVAAGPGGAWFRQVAVLPARDPASGQTERVVHGFVFRWCADVRLRTFTEARTEHQTLTAGHCGRDRGLPTATHRPRIGNASAACGQDGPGVGGIVCRLGRTTATVGSAPVRNGISVCSRLSACSKRRVWLPGRGLRRAVSP